ncbi:iron ABC transporter permease [Alteromonas sp. ASW11-19]|uniref:Iron ABC transporter permease n=1 Tax=Alteromonas salexigens TaxID=2982530 RepID=A0ABT2VPL8_9ALTE|nr:iron ABC transporter permease [Alteromonas salexigens]MCU7555258.1 iron ABC transporter permease [Alteromonas salexigens]
MPGRGGVLGGLGLGCAGMVALIAASTLASDLAHDLKWHIFTSLQLPLILTAALTGAVLTVSAATLQVVLRNPLADPGIIGVTSGASLVAAVLILTAPVVMAEHFYYLLPLGCFVGAMASTWFIYRLARKLQQATVAVILAGIAIATLSGAVIAWLYLFSDAQSLRNLTFWLMGSLYQADGTILVVAGPIMLVSCVVQIRAAKALNWLYAGDHAAIAAGVSPQKIIQRSLLAASVGVGAAVSVAGSIAFLGLLVPHLLRLALGFDNRLILPASALCGALFLLTVGAATEWLGVITLPVSMITATLGGPLLLWAIYRGQWR